MDTNSSFNLIWSKGYEVKITSTEIRVFSTEYNEMLDLDIYNSIVKVQHSGDVVDALSTALKQAVSVLEKM